LRRDYYVWIVLLLFSCAFGYAQIVNEGIFHISASSNVYFENDYTNKSSGIHSNDGNLYLNKNFTNNGTIATLDGTTYIKCAIHPVINVSDLTIANNLETDSTTVDNLFKVPTPQNYRIIYLGEKLRTFQINATLSEMANLEPEDYKTFFIIKNGSTTLIETGRLKRVNNAADLPGHSFSGTVDLVPEDYLEIWGQSKVAFDTSSKPELSLNINISN
jgi:hypothetical protein